LNALLLRVMRFWNIWLIEKLKIFILPSIVTKRCEGLMSLTTRPLAWKWSTNLARWKASVTHSNSLFILRFMISVNRAYSVHERAALEVLHHDVEVDRVDEAVVDAAEVLRLVVDDLLQLPDDLFQLLHLEDRQNADHHGLARRFAQTGHALLPLVDEARRCLRHAFHEVVLAY
jgi:hypothetical protein